MKTTRRAFNRVCVSSLALTVLGCGDGRNAEAPEEKDVTLAERPFEAGPVERYRDPGVYSDYFESHGIYLVSDGQQLVAFSAMCTHLDCAVDWVAAEESFHCPCHESRFSTDGFSGENDKAKRPLERLAITAVDGPEGPVVRVDPTESFRQERGQWENPASFLALS